ncbi:MAG: hypothetical protein JO269_02975 [Burkholderiaceae bacterium]|nr:hypothetical protein [Burkholderiaceae bacterium]
MITNQRILAVPAIAIIFLAVGLVGLMNFGAWVTAPFESYDTTLASLIAKAFAIMLLGTSLWVVYSFAGLREGKEDSSVSKPIPKPEHHRGVQEQLATMQENLDILDGLLAEARAAVRVKRQDF